MKEIPLTGSILKTVSDVDVQGDLLKPEGKSIASLINEQEENEEKHEEQGSGFKNPESE